MSLPVIVKKPFLTDDEEGERQKLILIKFRTCHHIHNKRNCLSGLSCTVRCYATTWKRQNEMPFLSISTFVISLSLTSHLFVFLLLLSISFTQEALTFPSISLSFVKCDVTLKNLCTLLNWERNCEWQSGEREGHTSRKRPLSPSRQLVFDETHSVACIHSIPPFNKWSFYLSSMR